MTKFMEIQVAKQLQPCTNDIYLQRFWKILSISNATMSV